MTPVPLERAGVPLGVALGAMIVLASLALFAAALAPPAPPQRTAAVGCSAVVRDAASRPAHVDPTPGERAVSRDR